MARYQSRGVSSSQTIKPPNHYWRSLRMRFIKHQARYRFSWYGRLSSVRIWQLSAINRFNRNFICGKFTLYVLYIQNISYLVQVSNYLVTSTA